MILIFTDGSSRGNPGPGAWAAIVALDERVYELAGFEERTTNNRMEMKAIIEALRSLDTKQEPITIYTDSKYTIDGITKWVTGWKRNGWKTKNKTEVLNKDLWETLDSLASPLSLNWHHVAGHVGIPGNERVDTIANTLAGGKKVALYDGPRKDYSVSLTTLASSSSRASSKGGKAYSYLALLDGELHRFSTWQDCEKFVKGKKARFRKATSKDEEQIILKEWGVVQ